MEVVKLMLGDLQTNCYIMINDINECIILDPGDESKRVIELLEHRDLVLKGILVTHGHFDHIGAVEDLHSHYGVDVFAHKGESEMMSDSKMNLSAMFNQKVVKSEASKYLMDDELINLGQGFSFKVIEVPGHTSHSLCFLHSEGHIFTGDTLFNGSIGRTDLYDGLASDLVENIRKKLFAVDKKTKVYPGHGTTTTIGYEMSTNPFFVS